MDGGPRFWRYFAARACEYAKTTNVRESKLDWIERNLLPKLEGSEKCPLCLIPSRNVIWCPTCLIPVGCRNMWCGKNIAKCPNIHVVPAPVAAAGPENISVRYIICFESLWSCCCLRHFSLIKSYCAMGLLLLLFFASICQSSSLGEELARLSRKHHPAVPQLEELEAAVSDLARKAVIEFTKTHIDIE
jgi:hypothetical protein